MIRGCVGTSSASRCARLGWWTNVLPDRLRKEHHYYTALSCCWLLLGHIFISFLIRVSPVDVGSSQRIYKMVSLHEANWVVPCAASLRSAVGALALLPYPESCGVTAEGLGLGCWLLSVTLLGQGGTETFTWNSLLPPLIFGRGRISHALLRGSLYCFSKAKLFKVLLHIFISILGTSKRASCFLSLGFRNGLVNVYGLLPYGR